MALRVHRLPGGTAQPAVLYAPCLEMLSGGRYFWSEGVAPCHGGGPILTEGLVQTDMNTACDLSLGAALPTLPKHQLRLLSRSLAPCAR